MLALGKSLWYFFTETFGNILHIPIDLGRIDESGFGRSFCRLFLLYVLYTAVVYCVARRLIGFRWSAETRLLFLVLLPIVATAFLVGRLLPLWPATIFGVVATVSASIFCLRELIKRIGPQHRIVRMACRVPGMRIACGL